MKQYLFHSHQALLLAFLGNVTRKRAEADTLLKGGDCSHVRSDPAITAFHALDRTAHFRHLSLR